MERGERITAWVLITAAVVVGYLFGGAAPLPHPWDDRPRVGGLSEVKEITKDGHTYETKECTGVVELWNKTDGSINYARHWRSEGPLPKKFTVINGNVIDLTKPAPCSFVEVDGSGVIKKREGESYGDYAWRCGNYHAIMRASSCKCPTDPKNIGRKPTEVQP